MLSHLSVTKVVVIGGSGLIGTKLVDRLRQKGHEVRTASLRSGVDTITGENPRNAPNRFVDWLDRSVPQGQER